MTFFRPCSMGLWGALVLCGACSAVVPPGPVADGALDQSMDVAPRDDGSAMLDRAETSPIHDVFDGGDATVDVVVDPPDAVLGDVVGDTTSDWPTAALHVANGEVCNALRIHAIVNGISRAEPFSLTLARGRIRDGVYWMTQFEHFPTPDSPDLTFRMQGMTMRIAGTRIEFARTFGVTTVFPQGLRRSNCMFDESGAQGQLCPYTCPDEKRVLGFSRFAAYEATGDQVRLWIEPILYTFTWMGPP